MGSGDYVAILLWIYHCHEVSVDVLDPYTHLQHFFARYSRGRFFVTIFFLFLKNSSTLSKSINHNETVGKRP